MIHFKRFSILLLLSLLIIINLTSCEHEKVNGIVVEKRITTSGTYVLHTLFVRIGNDIIPCNVSYLDYNTYEVGDSVHEKYMYLYYPDK